MKKIKCTPEKETLKTNIIERTIGRAVGITPHTEPFGPASADLIGDVFHSLYNAEFEPLEDKDAPHDRLINHALMKWMSKDEEFMAARTKTTGKLAHSLVSSRFLYEYLITDDAIRKALEVQEEPPSQPQPQLSDGGADGESGNNDDQNSSGGAGQKSDKKDENPSEAIDKALKNIQKLSQNVIGSKIMSVGAKKAEEQADKTDAAMRSWGVDPGDVTVNNIDDIMQLVDNNSRKIQEIADLAGRFESVAATALEKVREAYVGQIVDTKRTQDFSRMYETELCYLMSPDVPPLIHARYTADYLQSGLLGVEVRAEGKEFGSLYIMVDGSGSMDGPLEVHAKAVAMGLAKALNRDSLNNRQYILNTFGAEEDPFFTVKSEEDWKEHYKWASLQQSGGTDFDTAFQKAIRDIKQMPEGTDFVFITDGSCQLSDKMVRAWKKFKSETGTRLLYVDVSGYENKTVSDLADMYLKVDIRDGKLDIIASDIATKLAENMESSRLKRVDVESDT